MGDCRKSVVGTHIFIGTCNVKRGSVMWEVSRGLTEFSFRHEVYHNSWNVGLGHTVFKLAGYVHVARSKYYLPNFMQWKSQESRSRDHVTLAVSYVRVTRNKNDAERSHLVKKLLTSSVTENAVSRNELYSNQRVLLNSTGQCTTCRPWWSSILFFFSNARALCDSERSWTVIKLRYDTYLSVSLFLVYFSSCRI